jgi:hypothetical protein
LATPGNGGALSVVIGSGAGPVGRTGGGKCRCTGTSGLAGAGEATGADAPGCAAVVIVSGAGRDGMDGAEGCAGCR